MFKLEKIQKQLTLLIAFIALIHFYGCNKEEVEKDEKSYQMELKYDASSGDVVVEPAMQQYPENTMVRLTASPKEGYEFLGWKSDNVIISENQEISIKMSDNIDVVAYFESKTTTSFGESVFLMISCDSRKGEVEVSPDKFVYNSGETVTLTATSKEGYKFTGWKIDNKIISTETILTYKIEDDVMAEACFELGSTTSDETYSLDVSYNSDKGTVAISPEKDTYEENETVTITATPKEGYVFKEWQGIYGASNVLKIQMTGDKDITAVFEEEGNVSVTTSDVVFNFKGSYDEATGDWTFMATLKDVGEDQFITDATIKINDENMLNGVAYNDPRFKGDYYYLVMKNLGPDEVLNMSVKKGNIDFNKVINTPSYFTDNRNLEVRIKDTGVIIDWQALNCGVYQVYKKLEQTGRGITTGFLTGLPISKNHFETSLSALLANSTNITNADKVSVWVIPISYYNQLDGFHKNSVIQLDGKKGDVRVWNRR